MKKNICVILNITNTLARQIGAEVNALIMGTSVAYLSHQLIGLCHHIISNIKSMDQYQLGLIQPKKHELGLRFAYLKSIPADKVIPGSAL